MKFEEVLPEFKKGATIKRLADNKQKIYPDAKQMRRIKILDGVVVHANLEDFAYMVTAEDILAENWEIVG